MSWHEISYRVPYADTDRMGVVYYANYFVYFERSRTEMMRSAGFPYSELEKMGVLLPVVEAHCNYRASAGYDDLLTLKSAIIRARGVRLEIAGQVWRGDEMLVSGGVTLACVDTGRRPCRIPEQLLKICELYKGDGNEL